MFQRRLFLALITTIPISNPAWAGAKFSANSSGGVVIRSIDRHTLVVAVDRNDGDRAMDGLADLTFFYTSNDLLPEPISFRFPFANVEYSSREGFLRITSPDYGQILYTKIGRRAPEITPDAGRRLATDDKESGRWWLYDARGLALSAYRGRPELPLDTLATEGYLEAALGKAVPALSCDDIGP